MSWLYFCEGAAVSGFVGNVMNAQDLTERIKAELWDKLKGFNDLDEIQVWRLTPSLKKGVALDTAENLEFQAKLLENRSKMAWAFNSIQLERLVSDDEFVTTHHNGSNHVDFFAFKSEIFQRDIDLKLDEQYQDSFIKVTNWGSFCKEDLHLNAIRELNVNEGVPPFVEEFKQKLFQLTTLSNDIPEQLYRYMLSQPDCLSAYCDVASIPPSLADLATHQPQPHSSGASSHGDTATEHRTASSTQPSFDVQNDDSMQEDQPMVQVNSRDATLAEIAHLITLSLPWQGIWKDRKKGLPLKEGVFKAMMMASILLGVHKASPTGVHLTLGATRWNYPLIVERPQDNDTTDEDTALRKFYPKSDFSLLQGRLLRCHTEVNSVPLNQADNTFSYDRLRLILCASSTVRFANGHLPPFTTNKNFTLLSLYVRSNGMYDQMIFFQKPNDSKVYYTSTSLDLQYAAKRAEMALCLNNLVHMLSLSSREDLKSVEDEITAFSQSISKYNERHKMKSFYTKESQTEEEAENQGSRTPQGVSDAMGELASRGYDVEPEVIDCGGWELERLDNVISLPLLPTHSG
ncbi:hypothetical protein ONZ45_g1825 [Pleurotus djamor]|nr:hypothetical protein ONZ45_g1825 [Pleurotus djamor]